MSILKRRKHPPGPRGKGGQRLRRFPTRAAAVLGSGLLIATGVMLVNASSATANSATTTVSWVMDNTLSGGPNTPTYKQHLLGSPYAATCGHKEQIDTYRYDDQKNSENPSLTNKQFVDNLVKGGVLDNRPGHGPYDSSVFLSVEYADQAACTSGSPSPSTTKTSPSPSPTQSSPTPTTSTSKVPTTSPASTSKAPTSTAATSKAHYPPSGPTATSPSSTVNQGNPGPVNAGDNNNEAAPASSNSSFGPAALVAIGIVVLLTLFTLLGLVRRSNGAKHRS